ncbi:MAG TPA: hypothetical protein VFV52_08390 [Bacilli bacterium]|nr:hypothetical protein [Bacilli bacterium]
MKRWTANLLQKVPQLTVPKIITLLCLLALGLNGLVQVGIQHDMTEKAQELQMNVAKTQELSTQMKGGLHGLSDLQQSTAHMAGTLRQIHRETAGMSEELGELERTVSGIDSAVQQVGTSTKNTGATLTEAQRASADLLAVLRDIRNINGDVIANLQAMISAQKAINANLSEMNDKTAVLPQLGGGGQ